MIVKSFQMPLNDEWPICANVAAETEPVTRNG
jgi:hypothetical protein